MSTSSHVTEALATRTKYHKYHKPGGLNNRQLSFISHGSGSGKRSGCQHNRILVKACRWPCPCCILTWEGRGREAERHRKKTQLFGVFLGGHWSHYEAYICVCIYIYMTSQVLLVVKNLPANAEDMKDVGSIPGWGRSPRGGHGKPLQYSCLENPMDRGAWQAIAHRDAKRDINEAT